MDFIYFWEIKNTPFTTLQLGQYKESPVFCVPQFKNTEWYLVVYPNGDDVENKDTTGCYLCRGDDKGPETIEIKYNLSLSTEQTNFPIIFNFEKNSVWGYHDFLPHPLDFYGNSAVIICEMHLCRFDDGIPSNLELKTLEEAQSSSGSELTFPIKCFTETVCFYEKKSIQTSIDSLLKGISFKISIPLVWSEKFPSFMFNMEDKSEAINLNISSMDGPFKQSLTVICKVNITNNVGYLLYLFKEKHIFTAGVDEIWRLKRRIKKSQFKRYLSDTSLNEINLEADLAFSTGESFSEILNVEHVKYLSNFNVGKECIPVSKIYQLYTEKTLCDVSLKVGDSSIDVHKVVLCAASPVFAAMFTNEMTETKTNVVDIVDLEKKTVEKMIFFMYTGRVEELEYEMSKKLFVAGDKYQILQLMELCRNVIVSNLNDNTVWEILLIADTYNDIKLENESVKYIKSNKHVILSSSEWASFEREKTNFACKILRQVCLLNKRKRQ